MGTALLFAEEIHICSKIKFFLFEQKFKFTLEKVLLKDIINIITKCTELLRNVYQSAKTDNGPSLAGLIIVESDVKDIFLDIKLFLPNLNNFEIDIFKIELYNDQLYLLKNALTKLYYYLTSLRTISINSSTIFENLPVEICKYINVGQELKDSQEILQLRETLKDLKIITQPSIYVAIIGPSYMGKTQTAFTLSHLCNVLYVNLQVSSKIKKSDIDSIQSIYLPFRNIASIFYKCLGHDINTIGNELDTDLNSSSILNSDLPLQTLGLIFIIFKLKKKEFNARDKQSLENWFFCFINLGSIIIPELTVTQFKERVMKELDSDFLENSVIFIDELENPILQHVKILRNICRAVNLPCILSGTNSKVQNLIGASSINDSRQGPPTNWVKVVTKLPKATLNSLSHFISFKSWKNNDQSIHFSTFLKENPFENNEKFFTKILNELINVKRISIESIKKQLEKLIKITILQLKTNLPGLAILSFQSLFDSISISFSDYKSQESLLIVDKVWKRTIFKIITLVLNRKPKIAEIHGHLASAHILTFKDSFVKLFHETGSAATKKVENHLFYFGKYSEKQIITLKAGKKAKIISDPFDLLNREDEPSFTDLIVIKKDLGDSVLLNENEELWIDRCHFPKLSDDLYAHLIAWQSWNSFNSDGSRYSLALIYEKYLKEAFSFEIKSGAKVPDAFSLELLAHWSIAYASHYDVSGKTTGLKIIFEFLLNLYKPIEGDSFFFCNSDIPASLKEFLNRIRVPYLIADHDLHNQCNKSFIEELKPFIEFGCSWRPQNSIGFDVLFDLFLDETKFSGYIECKLWSTALGIGDLYTYYVKALKYKSPVSFLVCKSVTKNLKLNFDEILRLYEEKTIIKTKKRKVSPKTKTNVKSADQHHELLETEKTADIINFFKLWNGKDQENTPKNKINLYYVETEVGRNNFVSFKFNVLKEFVDPSGVFIIIKSNFCPPLRSDQTN